MKVISSLAVAAGLIASVNAHTRVFGVWVNDAFQGDGQNLYIRSPPSNSPVKDVTSTDIICNVNNVAVTKNVAIKAGDKVTFEWFHDTRGDDIIDSSHKGPITVYIAPLATNGKGAVWSKLAESGFVNGVWATQTLIANKGKHDVTIPASVMAGDYLLRAEIIALHEADTNHAVNSARGAQFYPSCSQFSITGTGSAVPDQAFNFQTGYTPSGAGILFNIYAAFTSYPIPGPVVWVPSSSSPVVTQSTTAVVSTATSKVSATQTQSKQTTLSTVTRSSASTTVASATTTAAASATITDVASATTTDVASATTTAASATTTAASATGTIFPEYWQCGGKMFTQVGTCVTGTICKVQNPYYFQCVKA